MGGTIAVTLRRADGREHRMARWTNVFSHILMDPAFIEGPDSFWDKYIALWDDMRDDWLKNHVTKNFRHNMTPCYGDWPLLAPTGYGLIVIDYKTKTILHSQGYSSMVKMLPGTFSDQPMHTGAEDWPDTRVVKLIEQGRVTREHWDGLKWIKPMLDHEVTSWEAENQRTKDAGFPASMRDQYPVDMSPWTVERFDEGAPGLREMKIRLAELEFKFSDDEETAWEDFFSEWDEDEEEDEEAV